MAKTSSSEKEEKRERKEGEEDDEESSGKDDREAITTSVSDVTTAMPGLSDKEGRLVGRSSKIALNLSQ